MTKLISIPSAAEILSISETTIRRWVQDNLITHVRLGGRVLLPEVDLERYVSERMVRPAGRRDKR